MRRPPLSADSGLILREQIVKTFSRFTFDEIMAKTDEHNLFGAPVRELVVVEEGAGEDASNAPKVHAWLGAIDAGDPSLVRCDFADAVATLALASPPMIEAAAAK